MYYKKIFILIPILSVMLISISSCFIPHGSSSTAEPTSNKALSLSSAPKLNDTAELTFVNNLKFYTTFLDDEPSSPVVRAWVEFTYANINGSYLEAKHAVPVPLDEVLVSGALAWEGNPYEIEDILELIGTVQFTREGIWEITGYIEAEGFNSPIIDKLFKEQMRVAVTEDNAAIIGSLEFRTGPLAYLGNFPYGRISGKRVPDERFNPTILELDISKIPEVGEEATLTCIIRSLVDVPDYSAEFIFSRRLDDSFIFKIPGENFLVDGDLKWNGDLKKNESVQFSASIRFAEEGDWVAQALGDDPRSPGNLIGDGIEMNITDSTRSFGWEERPAKPLPEGKEVPPLRIPTPK